MTKKFIEGNVVMNGESARDLLADFATLHMQAIRRLYITVEVLDRDDQTIEVLNGVSTSGNVSISGTSLIRRAGSLTFVLFDYLLPRQENVLWMTNKIRVYAGIDDLRSQDAVTTHFCLGTFFISEPNVAISNDSRTITINLEDKMAMWGEEQFENKLIIEPDTPVHIAIQSVLSVMGETQFGYIQDSTETVPYQIEFAQGSSVLDALNKLVDLYMDWEAYYNTEGFFVYQKMTMKHDREMAPQWVYDEHSPLLISFNEAYTYKGVKNRVIVFGAMNEKTGLTPRSQADLLPELKLGANNIGIKKKVFVESSYTKKEQCASKAKFELWKASTLQEKVTITSLPIYFLDANDIIEVWNPADREYYRYSIDSISYGLGVSDTMQITASRVYYDDVLMDVYDEKIDYIIDMITNKGWLSIPEKRIKEYYGLEGDGAPLVINFEYNQVAGTTAYVTGYLGTNYQTLTIDLVDLGFGIGDSGDNALPSKGDYTDRIIGHEMLHAVMNNQFGMDKIQNMPDWFLEGCAEFLHGADERLKLSIMEDGVVTDSKASQMVNRCVSMLRDNTWSGASDDYSAGYVIMKYIDKKILFGLDMKSIMIAIKNSSSDGLTAMKEAIVANTVFYSFDELIVDFQENGVQFLQEEITLNPYVDEEDTGSVAGNDHRGAFPLNAEMVFDNSTAVAGLISTGFTVEFERP
ncbi:DUF5048 domain-containing protein [Peribacillus asahii]|uniref:DUF5048 domain-containing protein n=1 Tax=Peribacillus asahii TaxID=228899 RepID=UPI0037F439BC